MVLKKLILRKIFLIDGFGALLTALLMGVLLPSFPETFGVSVTVAIFLAAIALGYSVYSLSCYFLKFQNTVFHLRNIIYANLIYCGITLGLLSFFSNEFKALGLIYFAVELLVIFALVIIEIIIFSKLSTANNY